MDRGTHLGSNRVESSRTSRRYDPRSMRRHLGQEWISTGSSSEIRSYSRLRVTALMDESCRSDRNVVYWSFTHFSCFAMDDQRSIDHQLQLSFGMLTKGQDHSDRRRVMILETEFGTNVVVETWSIILTFAFHTSNQEREGPSVPRFVSTLTDYIHRIYLHASKTKTLLKRKQNIDCDPKKLMSLSDIPTNVNNTVSIHSFVIICWISHRNDIGSNI